MNTPKSCIQSCIRIFAGKESILYTTSLPRKVVYKVVYGFLTGRRAFCIQLLRFWAIQCPAAGCETLKNFEFPLGAKTGPSWPGLQKALKRAVLYPFGVFLFLCKTAILDICKKSWQMSRMAVCSKNRKPQNGYKTARLRAFRGPGHDGPFFAPSGN